jgi:hypothetical protein
VKRPVYKGDASKRLREFKFSFSTQIGEREAVRSALHGNGSALSPVLLGLHQYQPTAGSVTPAPAMN